MKAFFVSAVFWAAWAGPALPREPIPDKLVVLTFDDASKSHFTIARPILKKYGFGATFFITEGFDFPTNKRDYMTWDEIALLGRDGFEIGNHTRDHRGVTERTLRDLPAQVRAINTECQKHGIPIPVSFAYPGNAIDRQALPILKELGFKFARRGGAPEYPYKDGQGFAYEPGLDHPLLIPSAGDARPDWTLDDFKRAVNQARHGKVAVLQFHGVPDTAHDWVTTSQKQFEAYMKYLIENKFHVIALRELAKYVDSSVSPSDPWGVIKDRQHLLELRKHGSNARLARNDSEPAFAGQAESRLRVIIETDAGGDPDDEQSLVRFLLYTNEWDVEGIIANRPHTLRPENKNPEPTGLGVVRRLVQAYGECYRNLAEHDPRYPNPAPLLARTVAGYDETDEAVKLIIRAVDRSDPRPIWYADWGSNKGSAVNNLKRALDRILQERGPKGYVAFKSRLRVICHDNPFGEHTTLLKPPFPLLLDTYRPALEGRRWYHRFSALTATAGGFDLRRDLLTNHGTLAVLYPTNTTHPQKEGDTMTFLYLIPTGLGDPERPSWGSWAGRYGLNPEFKDRQCYWANQADLWNGTTHRDNTVKRWSADLQNDFRARLEWCVQPVKKANHPPRVVINGIEGQGILQLSPAVGAGLTLDASGSSDADGDLLRYHWSLYPEAGTYGKSVNIDGAATPTATLHTPADAANKEIHVILAVTDSGKPPLTRYRRVVVRPRDPAADWRTLSQFFQPPAELANKFGSFRSPLLFQDGTRVRSATDWPRRRQEIATNWRAILGPWPPVLRQPKVEVLSKTRRDNFTQYRVRLEIAPAQMEEGWLMVPDSPGSFPAVLVVYYEPETSAGLNAAQPLRDFGVQLARRGFVTLSIGTPGGNAWRPNIGKAQTQPLSFHAYVAANCWHVLANRTEVDAKRIGVVGHSYGGKWALFAAALWDKFACVAVSDPGIVFDEKRPNVNYWEPWYLGLDPRVARQPGVPSADNPRTGAYKQLVEAGLDLHELHALIAPRPFLVSGGSEDTPERWVALNHTLAVNTLLGQSQRVGMTNRKEHTPTEESNAQLYAFFEHFLMQTRE